MLHRAFTAVELLSTMVAIVIVAFVLVMHVGKHKEVANRTKCSRHLRSIGQAILLYSNENKGRLPRTLYAPGPTVTPVWGTATTITEPFGPGGPVNDVSAIWFLIIRTEDIGSEIFICPSLNRLDKDVYGGGNNGPLQRSNFTAIPRNLSYSIHNPYAKDGVFPAAEEFWHADKLRPDFAVAADINPGTAGGGDVLGVRLMSSAANLRRANSLNHRRDGQNVLYGDGHVEFQSHPFVGIERDNIYTTQAHTVIDSTASPTDSILLPTDD